MSNPVETLRFRGRSHGAALDASGAAEPDRHLVPVHDHRHGAPSAAVAEHPFEFRGVLLDVDVLERDVPPLVVVTGGLRVGSSVLAEDIDHRLILPPLIRLPWTRSRSSSARVSSGNGMRFRGLVVVADHDGLACREHPVRWRRSRSRTATRSWSVRCRRRSGGPRARRRNARARDSRTRRAR